LIGRGGKKQTLLQVLLPLFPLLPFLLLLLPINPLILMLLLLLLLNHGGILWVAVVEENQEKPAIVVVVTTVSKSKHNHNQKYNHNLNLFITTNNKFKYCAPRNTHHISRVFYTYLPLI
jgi:hypothetical protein